MEVERRAAMILAFCMAFRSRLIVKFCFPSVFVVAITHPSHLSRIIRVTRIGRGVNLEYSAESLTTDRVPDPCRFCKGRGFDFAFADGKSLGIDPVHRSKIRTLANSARMRHPKSQNHPRL